MTKARGAVSYDVDEACLQLAAADPKLAALIGAAGPFTLQLKSEHSPFEALLESILYQQIHGSAAAAILRRLLELFGDIHPTPELLLAQPDEALRAVGLSKNKMLALQDLSRKTLDGTVPTLAAVRRMTDEEIVERLTAVRGIGVWTVQMMLIFRLGRPDVLPVTDYGVRKGFALTFKRLPKAVVSRTKPFDATMLAKAVEIERRARKWQPWRSVASWYLWRACDLYGKPSPPPE
jgi:DNA-3-methyladenine glycosylase II